MIKVIQPVNDLFRKKIDYRTHSHIKQSARYDYDVSREPHEVAKKNAVQMTEQEAFVKNFHITYRLLEGRQISLDTCGIPEGAASWLFNQYLTEPARLLSSAGWR